MLPFQLLTVEAAKKIQAVFRGHQVRSTMKQGDSNSTSTTMPATSNNTAITPSNDPSKEELEAEFNPNDKGEWEMVYIVLVHFYVLNRNRNSINKVNNK